MSIKLLTKPSSERRASIKSNNQKIEATREPKRIVKALMGSLSQNASKEIYKNSQKLYQIGEPSLAPLIEAVLPHNWSKVDNKGQIRLLTGIIALINDINEEACHKTVQTIIEKGCTRDVKLCLNSITSFTLNDYTLYTEKNVKIYILNELNNIDFIKDKLREWLSFVPNQDLKQIDRIYLIPYNEEYTYSGTYTPILSYIRLVWERNQEDNFIWKWIDLIRTENTLYHEIGHHYNTHTFGQDPEQEEEADEYAIKLMRKAHPNITKVVKTLKYLDLRKQQVD